MSEQTAPPVGTQGLGRPPATPIVTLPPIEKDIHGIPVSETTGQPQRHPVMIVANVFFYISCAIGAAALGIFWWQAIHMQTFPHSAHLVEIVAPRPGSKASVFTVIAVMAMNTIAVAASAVTAFNSWNGHRWTRIAGIVSTLLGCLAFFLHPWAWYAVPFAAVGALILWLPPLNTYFTHWERFRAPDKPEPRPAMPVHYGPLPRFQ